MTRDFDIDAEGYGVIKIGPVEITIRRNKKQVLPGAIPDAIDDFGQVVDRIKRRVDDELRAKRNKLREELEAIEDELKKRGE